jgi:hypothetical protein
MGWSPHIAPFTTPALGGRAGSREPRRAAGQRGEQAGRRRAQQRLHQAIASASAAHERIGPFLVRVASSACQVGRGLATTGLACSPAAPARFTPSRTVVCACSWAPAESSSSACCTTSVPRLTIQRDCPRRAHRRRRGGRSRSRPVRRKRGRPRPQASQPRPAACWTSRGRGVSRMPQRPSGSVDDGRACHFTRGGGDDGHERWDTAWV